MRFIDIGAGKVRRKGWTHVGHESAHYAKNIVDIDADFMTCEHLPIGSNVAEAVYCGHTLEHLPNHRARWVMEEAYRTLNSGGIFRVVVPDAGAAMMAVLLGARTFFGVYDGGHYDANKKRYRLKRSLAGAPLEQYLLMMCATQLCEYVDTEMSTPGLNEEVRRYCQETNLDGLNARCNMMTQGEYPWMHCNWFSAEKLETMLGAAGFSTIIRSGHQKSFSPYMRGATFDALPELSLHMEAIR